MNANNQPDRNRLAEIFVQPIGIYTRAQAIADGVLVDGTATAKEAGFRHSTVVTGDLWQVIQTISQPGILLKTRLAVSGT